MKVYFSIDQTPEGALQLAINDENGGYRIFGPKYDGRSKTIRKHELTERDISEIGQYLVLVGGSPQSGASSQGAESTGGQIGGSK